jgi:hypothetical protein
VGFSQNIISLAYITDCAAIALPIQVDEEDIPFFAEVIAGGRITIPEEIRKIFGVKDGDHVMCRVRLVKRAEDVK